MVLSILSLKCVFYLQKALEHGYKTVRVRVKGLGPGRMVSVD